MRLDLPWGAWIGIAWIGAILWMGVKLLFAPEGVEDERGFRVIPPKR